MTHLTEEMFNKSLVGVQDVGIVAAAIRRAVTANIPEADEYAIALVLDEWLDLLREFYGNVYASD